jgi:hypothetical protein
MSTSQILNQRNPVPADQLVATDGTTISGAGVGASPLRAIGGGGGAASLPVRAGDPIVGDFAAEAGKVNVLSGSQGGAVHIALPAASSLANGAMLAIRNSTGICTTSVFTDCDGSDTIDNMPTGIKQTSDEGTVYILLVTDGVSNWVSLVLDAEEEYQ